MHRTYAALGWLMVAFGFVHVLAATRFYDQVTPAALWFVSGGLAIMLTGAINLLNRSYGHAAPGLRRVCGATNLLMGAFALLSGVVDDAPAAQLVIVVGLFAAATVLAVSPTALVRRGAA